MPLKRVAATKSTHDSGSRKRLTRARIAVLTGISERTIHNILAPAGVSGAKGYDPAECIGPLVRHFRDVASKLDSEAAKDRARETKANADNAEIEAERNRGSIIVRAHVAAMLADIFTRHRQCIERSALTEKQKDDLLKRMLAVRMMEMPE